MTKALDYHNLFPHVMAVAETLTTDQREAVFNLLDAWSEDTHAEEPRDADEADTLAILAEAALSLRACVIAPLLRAIRELDARAGPPLN
jgi:hypothetical protein